MAQVAYFERVEGLRVQSAILVSPFGSGGLRVGYCLWWLSKDEGVEKIMETVLFRV